MEAKSKRKDYTMKWVQILCQVTCRELKAPQKECVLRCDLNEEREVALLTYYNALFRKIFSQLSSNLRHIRVFEMDVEDDGEAEEEEEEEETTQYASRNQEHLNPSADNLEDGVCVTSAKLTEETKGHDSSPDV